MYDKTRSQSFCSGCPVPRHHWYINVLFSLCQPTSMLHQHLRLFQGMRLHNLYVSISVKAPTVLKSLNSILLSNQGVSQSMYESQLNVCIKFTVNDWCYALCPIVSTSKRVPLHDSTLQSPTVNCFNTPPRCEVFFFGLDDFTH